MNVISHRFARLAIWLLLIAAVIYSVDQFFFPINQYHYDDEWFVLPERVWYRDGYAWLKHLLFFSQTRITWVGDFMLVRPGLFSWIWLQDMLVRSDRMAQQFLMIGVAAFAFAVFYYNVFREAGAMLAVAGCLYAFTCLGGTDLYTWPHINGYVFAMALYTLGVSVLLSPKLTVPWKIFCFAALFKAEIFHEFVPLAVLALIFVEMFFWRKKDRLESSNARLVILIGALGAYAALVGVAYLFLRPPAIFSPGEADNLVLSGDYLFRVLQVQFGFLLGVLNDLTPFYLFNSTLNWFRMGLGFAGVVCGTWLYLRSDRAENRKLTACLVAVLVLFVGLLLGRTATRGVIKVHYYPMIQYFLVMAGVLMGARFLRSRPRWYLGVTLLLVASSVYSATLIGNMNQAREDIVDVTSVAAVNLRDYLREHGTTCFAGVFDPYFRSRLNASLNIAFMLDACGTRAGKSVYFRAASDGALNEYAPALMFGAWVQLTTGLANDDLGIVNYLGGPQYNIYEAEQNLRHSGVLKIHPAYGDIVARALSVKYESLDDFPQLWNVGVKISGAGIERYFLLWNNMLRIVSRDPRGEVTEEAAVAMVEMNKSSELRLAQDAEGCSVFWGGHLMTQLKSCFAGPVQVGLVSFENGTPEESMVGVSYLRAN